MALRCKHWRTPRRKQVARARYGERSSHHDGEARVPGAENIEEAQDLLRVDPPGNQQAPAEDEAAREAGEEQHVSLRGPIAEEPPPASRWACTRPWPRSNR